MTCPLLRTSPPFTTSGRRDQTALPDSVSVCVLENRKETHCGRWATGSSFAENDGCSLFEQTIVTSTTPYVSHKEYLWTVNRQGHKGGPYPVPHHIISRSFHTDSQTPTRLIHHSKSLQPGFLFPLPTQQLLCFWPRTLYISGKTCASLFCRLWRK